MNTKPTINRKKYLAKFSNWISSELNKGNFSIHEAEAMNQDFSSMSEARLKRLLNNFNL